MQSRFAQDVVDYSVRKAGLWDCGEQRLQNAMNDSRYSCTRYPTEESPYARTLTLGWVADLGKMLTKNHQIPGSEETLCGRR